MASLSNRVIFMTHAWIYCFKTYFAQIGQNSFMRPFWGFLIEYQDIVKTWLKTSEHRSEPMFASLRLAEWISSITLTLSWEIRKMEGKFELEIWKCERLNQRPKEWGTANKDCYVSSLGMAMPILLDSFIIPFRSNPSYPLGFFGTI